MRADVAVGERAVDRVGERVQRDVGVGVAAERLRMRDADAAQPDMVAGREGVPSKPWPTRVSPAAPPASLASAARRSCIVVTLRFAGSPSKTKAGAPANSATATSSVR